MKDLIWEVKYELIRTLKHIFYVLLVICWFAFWYAIAYLFIGEWNMQKWTELQNLFYWSQTLIWGIGYLIYRVTS